MRTKIYMKLAIKDTTPYFRHGSRFVAISGLLSVTVGSGNIPYLTARTVGKKNVKLTASASRPLYSMRSEKYFLKRPSLQEWLTKA
jgi:hypothetical protein